MPSNYETFWEHASYAVVGHSARMPFPGLTYGGLKQLGKTVYPVDPEADQVAGDSAFRDLSSLPGPVEAVVLEVPREETRDWVEKAAQAGVKHLWIHMGTETPEAVALAEQSGMNVRTGTCGAMYVTPGFTYHSIHKWIMQLVGKY